MRDQQANTLQDDGDECRGYWCSDTFSQDGYRCEKVRTDDTDSVFGLQSQTINEDKLNEDLAKTVPWNCDDIAMDEPSTKANLLIQAHLSRLPLPISDYVTDTKSVLDQAIRILQAMVDIQADKGWLTAVIRTITLLQMIVQARWVTDSTLLNLPAMTPQNIEYLWNRRIESLAELLPLSQKELIALMNKAPDPPSKPVCRKLVDIVSKLPRVQFQCQTNKHEYEPGQEVTIRCRFKRFSGHHTKIYAPKWPKAKLEGWFVIVGCEEDEKLYACKRIRVEHRWKSSSLKFEAPEAPGKATYQVYMLSDSYLGLDQQYKVTFTVEDVEETLDVDDFGILPEGDFDVNDTMSVAGIMVSMTQSEFINMEGAPI